MAVYLQFDSSARSDAYIQRNDLGIVPPGSTLWVPNDNYPNDTGLSYQQNRDLVQSSTNYRVFYKELNSTNNIRTLSYLAHCKEKLENIVFTAELCVVNVPSNAVVPRVDSEGAVTYMSILDEPYLYVRVMPISHAEGKLIYSNNPAANDATFIVWCDKVQVSNNPSPPNTGELRPPPPIDSVNNFTWIVYKSCMNIGMRMDLAADEWQIRFYDRYGNDVLVPEDDNGGAGFIRPEEDGPPPINPDLQTNVLIGLRPQNKHVLWYTDN